MSQRRFLGETREWWAAVLPVLILMVYVLLLGTAFDS